MQRRWRWCLLCLFGGSLAACGQNAGDAAHPSSTLTAATMVAAAGVAPAYTVVNLDAANSNGFPVINASNQVAFTVYRDGNLRAGFFNGDTVRPIGTFGGRESVAGALNDAGQVVGIATNAGGASLGYRWSETGGLVPLGMLGGLPVRPTAINRRGEVTGWARDDDPAAFPRGFFWSDTGGLRDLGALGAGGAEGEAINDAGMVAGRSQAADGLQHAFVWTAAGMVDLGTNGGIYSNGELINNAGQVAGSVRADGTSDINYHGFVWSQAAGIVDIGTLGGRYSFLGAMNQAGQVVGVSDLDCTDCFHAISWSPAGGLTDLGTLGGKYSQAYGINNHAAVVGWSETLSSESRNFHAFAWTGAQGMADLNGRIPNAPEGLELTSALAISDNGAIVADSTAGLVLLVPGTGGTDAPVVGPITPEGPVPANTPVAFAVSFTDRNSTDRHSAVWSWNDGCGPDAVSKVQGPGKVRANHTFCASGTYVVTFKATDSSGRSTTVRRELLVFDSAAARPAAAGRR